MKLSTISLSLTLVFLPHPSIAKNVNKVAHLPLFGVVDEEMAIDFLKGMTQALKERPNAIVVEINSPGGRVDVGFIIAKAIENSPVPVICVVDGDAASMAFYILQSCDYRAMTRRSTLMFHTVSISVQQYRGQVKDFQALIDAMQATNKAALEHTSAKLCIAKDTFWSYFSEKDYWMDWSEALRIGAVDGVFSSVAEVGRALVTGQRLENPLEAFRCPHQK